MDLLTRVLNLMEMFNGYIVAVSLAWVTVHLHVVACDACNDSGHNNEENCWYTFWYVWLALGLFIAVLITIIVVYYKHKWAKRRTRIRRISVVRPQAPPPYTAPSQSPPSYEDALKESYPVPPGYTGCGDPGYTGINSINVHPLQIQRNTTRTSVDSSPPSYTGENTGGR